MQLSWICPQDPFRNIKIKLALFCMPVCLLILSTCTYVEPKITNWTDWPNYGGNPAGNRYSALKQVNVSNVSGLEVAWIYDSDDPSDVQSTGSPFGKTMETQPIMIGGTLYGVSPGLKLFAINALTGRQLWKFTPRGAGQRFDISRGVTYWRSGNNERIFYSSGPNLYALNAKTGKLIDGFGQKGVVDLHTGLGENLGHDIAGLQVSATSPGVIYKNTLIMGSSALESGDAAPGDIRGFDALTGKLKWVFHTVPHPGELGYETWAPKAYRTFGAANCWGGMTVDTARGMVYAATGSPANDYYGEGRQGTNLFGNCVLALNAETGKLKWYFQTVHHDLWDRDLPCAPNLATVKRKGKTQDVVVQATKDGLVYVLDRDNGTSLFPIEERPAPTAGLPGEHPWPTQKYPFKPLPLCNQLFTGADITNISPQAHAYIKKRFDDLHSENKYTPPNTRGTLLFGYSGGAEWGGNAIDPDGILYQNANNDPWELQMIDTPSRNSELAKLGAGNALFIKNCAVCHGADRKGGFNVPGLINAGRRFSANNISQLLINGAGRMPSFKTALTDTERNAITGFLLNNDIAVPRLVTANKAVGAKEIASDFPYRPLYVRKVWRVLTDQEGYPGVKPPWGTLNAIDLKTGDYLWRVPLGEYPELKKKGVPPTGTPNYGGPLVTAGGLIFIAATMDEKIRAFDKKNGKIVWEHPLPAGGFATPITYEINGKQFIVIAAGGGRGRGGASGKYVAFALN